MTWMSLRISCSELGVLCDVRRASDSLFVMSIMLYLDRRAHRTLGLSGNGSLGSLVAQFLCRPAGRLPKLPCLSQPSAMAPRHALRPKK